MLKKDGLELKKNLYIFMSSIMKISPQKSKLKLISSDFLDYIFELTFPLFSKILKGTESQNIQGLLAITGSTISSFHLFSNDYKN